MYDHELDTFKRGINLVEFAASRYGYRRIARHSSRSSHALEREVDHDKILVTRQADGHWVYCSVRDNHDRGTIVDFVQRRGRMDLGRARQELREWLRLPRPDPGPAVRPVCPFVPRDPGAIAEAFAAAREAETSLYLNGRGVRPETLRDPRFAARWRVDRRGNVLFPHGDELGAVCGFEIKNTRFTGFATGGRKTLWQSTQRATDSVVVICESAIDALSYHQLFKPKHSWYASVAGALSPEQIDRLGRTFARLPPRTEIVAAVDADDGGSHLATTLAELAAAHGVRIARLSPVPTIKDWNDVLQRVERDYIASLPKRHRSPTAQERAR